MSRTSTVTVLSEQPADNNAIRPFHVDVPEAELTTRRSFLTASVAAGAFGLALLAAPGYAPAAPPSEGGAV